MEKIVSAEIEQYCEAHSTKVAPVFEELKKVTYEKMHAPQMQVGALEGNFLRLLVASIQAKVVLELGTFTGYSTLMMAQGLQDGGRIYTCDIDAKATALAQEFWNLDPHGKKIHLLLGPALESIVKIVDPIDFVFIDADKSNYSNYWNAVLPKVRSGGLIVVDNVLWSGRVLNPQDASDKHIHQFNNLAANDARVDCVMLTVRDGMMLARKK